MKTKSTRGAATRLKILEAAAELINRKGFNATSVDDILEASGTGKSQFYHYFNSKNQLARELTQLHAEAMPLVRLTTADALRSLEDFEAALEALLESHRNGKYLYGCPTSNLATELVAGSEELSEYFREIFSEIESRITQAIARLRFRGQVRQDVIPESVASFIFSSIEGALLLTKISGKTDPLAATVVQLRSYLRSLTSKQPSSSRQFSTLRPASLTYCP